MEEGRGVTGCESGSAVGDPWFKGVSTVFRPAKSLARERRGGQWRHRSRERCMLVVQNDRRD